ncbi:auxin-responsive protein SAUR77 isoform X1 [Zea mays]|jgi:hypothetical protein|uniref:SAUR-like auxin-responsive protein family n=1 Tax=Zea mays TaxID=4577 RepID=A0A1D6MWB3_MAIZE|nr:auxin-responsive protein SAUR77 isoform X1 [Zea mays]ONM33082.1 SAUR-like auxin-responsive protein family [Zea mays]|eukprot:XP_008674297.1 uncharacterized protein LOC103650488 isoform X1 [Zea mays]
MNRFKNVVLRKCKSLSSRVGRPPSASPSYRYSSLRSMSMSTRRDAGAAAADADEATAAAVGGGAAAVIVGSSRRRYVISAEHLSHPLIAALIDDDERHKEPVAVNCEVVLFDHLLWMLDNAVDLHDDDDAMRELAQLYAC